jgi:cell division protein FtsI/penicillin-binding protein 2
MSRAVEIRQRFWFSVIIIFGTMIVFMGRAFYLQIITSDTYRQWKQEKYLRKTVLQAPRGSIYDRNGKLLADNLIYYELYCEPHKLKDKKGKTIQFLKTIFKEEFNQFASKLNAKRTVLLTKRVDVKKAEKIKKFREKNKLVFLFLRPYYKRIYPYQSYAGQVIGFVNYLNHGVSGIEYKYDRYLKGEDGYQYINITPKWVAWQNLDIPGKPPIPGDNVYLTIDLELQAIAEEELSHAVNTYRAIGGMVVMMNPKTAEILAIASVPRFDPNNPGKYKSMARKNRAITDIFEPGSTFKPIVAAALLEKSKISLDSLVYCENGKYQLYKTVFHDHKKYGWLTFKKVLAYSSNIGMIKTTMNILDNRELYNFIKSMGFGSKTNVDLSGESAGILHPVKKWSGITKASMSFGHEIGVTALQMANAYVAIANGGKLMKPYLVRSVKRSDGKEVLSLKPRELNTVFSQKTSDLLKLALRDVVENGTGKLANIKNLSIAGKTGTSEKLNARGSGYSKSNYIASFIGFFPVSNPELVILVMLDSPQAPHHTGGSSAAPTFSKIVKRIVGLPGFAKLVQNNTKEYSLVYVPDLTGYTIEEAQKILKNLNLNYVIKGDGTYIVGQNIKDEKVNTHTRIILKTEKDLKVVNTMPNLKGKSLKEAILILNRLQIPFEITGHGMVVKQVPGPGKRLNKIKQIELVCKVG